jgi:hypothetical protein
MHFHPRHSVTNVYHRIGKRFQLENGGYAYTLQCSAQCGERAMRTLGLLDGEYTSSALNWRFLCMLDDIAEKRALLPRWV